MEEKLEQAISNICDWINSELKHASSVQTKSMLPEMIEALVKLVAVSRM